MVGANVVVIGGGSAGAEVANHLAVHLKAVTIVEMGGAIAPHEALAPRWNLLSSLEKRKVQMKLNTTVEEIKEKSVVVKSSDGVYEIPADSVVLAVGVEPVSLDIPNATIIGDAAKIGNALDAIEKGYEVALTL
jgi:NADH dehydrogenase FAD-containing subunit